MNTNILRYSRFSIAGSQEVDHIFVKFIIYPLTMIALSLFVLLNSYKAQNLPKLQILFHYAVY